MVGRAYLWRISSNHAEKGSEMPYATCQICGRVNVLVVADPDPDPFGEESSVGIENDYTVLEVHRQKDGEICTGSDSIPSSPLYTDPIEGDFVEIVRDPTFSAEVMFGGHALEEDPFAEGEPDVDENTQYDIRSED